MPHHRHIDAKRARELTQQIQEAVADERTIPVVALCENCRSQLFGVFKQFENGAHAKDSLTREAERYEIGKKLIIQEVESGVLILDIDELARRLKISRTLLKTTRETMRKLKGESGYKPELSPKENTDRFMQNLQALVDGGIYELTDKSENEDGIAIFLGAVLRHEIHIVLGDEEFLEKFRQEAGVEA